jgi:hypothetical protein
VLGRDQSGRFPKSALGTVALHRAAEPPCRGEPDPHRELAVSPVASLRQDGPDGPHDALGGQEKVRPFLQTFDGGR